MKDKSRTKFEDVVRDLQDVYSYKDDHNDYSDYRLFITGHSLGGALATLTTVALAGCEIANSIPGIFPVTAITFASPRVGNRGFQNLHRVSAVLRLQQLIRSSFNCSKKLLEIFYTRV